MATQEVDLSTLLFHDPKWLAEVGGGWVHANNVLFYFALSPFFDRLSSNNTVYVQSQGNPEREHKFLANRQKFETELQRHKGIQFVVDVDPLANPVMVDGPNGQEPSDLWIIRKQDRLEIGPQGKVKILDYYYIMNQVIFQAPRLESIFNYRMMNSLLAIDKIVQTASELPFFSASYGHTYLPQGQKSTPATQLDTQPGEAGTALPESDSSATQQVASQQEMSDQQSDERTLRDALRLTLEHGGQFSDDAPLIGEPGNFRYAKPKDPLQSLRAAETGSVVRSAAPSKAATPVPSQPMKTGSNPTSPNGTQRSNDTAEPVKPKPKRKKSMAVAEQG